MDGVNYLNLEYFILLIYRLATGTNVDITEVPQQMLTTLESIAWIGILLAIFFLAYLIFIHLKLHALIHDGWHHRDEEVEALRRHHTLKQGKNPQWEHVQMLMHSGTSSDWRTAIIEADIMLDSMLTKRGYAGATLSDKFKGANPLQFTTLNLARAAHRVRNDIAHSGERFLLDEREANATIDLYKRVFEEFDYL